MGDEQAHDNLGRDEDDHDLLTYSESTIRLRTEITRTEEALRENPAERPDRRARPQHPAGGRQSWRKRLPRLHASTPGRHRCAAAAANLSAASPGSYLHI
jgi:hypothetical protein